MLIALIADIHANLPALEAVLSAIAAHRPDMILSLGDQVNLGPCPRETLSLLRQAGAKCLSGNHERYILSAMRGDPAYAGANFASLRFNAARLKAEDITFEETFDLEGITFCHSMPGDDRFPINDPTLALPRLRALRFDRPRHIICGHGHNPTHYQLPGLRVDGIGSAGCMDEGAPGIATYTLLQLEGGAAVLKPINVAYDAQRLPGLFRSSGMADYCPVMAHITCLQMMRNRDFLVPFVRQALSLSAARGETHVSLQTWQDTDAAYPWPDGEGTAAFWRRHR